MRIPSGHSLAELLVALMFATVAFGAAVGGAVAAYRNTVAAALRQEAAAAAVAIMDSLTALTRAPSAGERGAAGMTTVWSARSSGAASRVEVRSLSASGRELVRLEGVWIPLPDTLPSPPPDS